MVLQRYGGDRSLGVAFAARQVKLSDNRRPNSGTSRIDKDLPVSSLRTMLQSEKIAASTHCGRVRQGAAAQVSLLSAPEQVQGQHNEARHTCTPEFAISVTWQLIVYQIILFILFFYY